MLDVEPKKDITRILAELKAGKPGAGQSLFGLLYNELHALAQGYMRGEKTGHTLQPTALVHEAYLRLGGDSKAAWENRAHFLKTAARAMRRVLIDHAHRKSAEKRGGGREREMLGDFLTSMEESSTDLIALDSALQRLSEIDPRGAQVVELRFFGGQSIKDIARIMGVSSRTVDRDWLAARAWLKKEMGKG